MSNYENTEEYPEGSVSRLDLKQRLLEDLDAKEMEIVAAGKNEIKLGQLNWEKLQIELALVDVQIKTENDSVKLEELNAKKKQIEDELKQGKIAA